MKESVISPLSYFTPPPQGLIITIQFVYHLQGLPHLVILFFYFCLSFVEHAVFLGMLSAYHHLTLLRQHCCIYLVLFNVIPPSFALYILIILLLILVFEVGLLVLAFSCHLGCTNAIAQNVYRKKIWLIQVCH